VLNTYVRNGKVKISFNITDDKNKAFVYAHADKFTKSWCLFREEVAGDVYPVKNYRLIQTNERDTVSNAFAFVLDHSGSMGDFRVLSVQNAISNLLTSDIKAEDGASVIKFDHNVVVDFPLTRDDKVFMSQLKVNGIADFGGNSAVTDAIAKAIEILDAGTDYKNKCLVVLTDGTDNASKTNKDEVISKIKQKEIKLFAIGFGAFADENYLIEMARETGGCYYHIYNTSEFNLVFTDIYKRMKNRYEIEYTPALFGKSLFRMNLCIGNKKIQMLDSINNETAIGNSILVNIKFDPGKTNVKSNFKPEIDKLVKIMTLNKITKFQIQVHTDDAGDAKVNLSLSQKRAEAIKNEIVKKGIDKSRLLAKGFGETMPVADNKTKEGKNLNRRVEFVVIE
jgi:flagellar motor protein MotB